MLVRASNLWLNYVANGEAFAAENFVGPGVGNQAHIQLFNPVGSGKRVRMRSVSSSSTSPTVTNFIVARYDVALTTLGVPAGFTVENLLGGGPAAVAEMRSQISAVALGTDFTQVYAPTTVMGTYPTSGREWGYDLLPGQGILLRGTAAAVLIVNWQWAEVPS
jgi:hypothetical protein